MSQILSHKQGDDGGLTVESQYLSVSTHLPGTCTTATSAVKTAFMASNTLVMDVAGAAGAESRAFGECADSQNRFARLEDEAREASQILQIGVQHVLDQK
jgi:hypothetical protein